MEGRVGCRKGRSRVCGSCEIGKDSPVVCLGYSTPRHGQGWARMGELRGHQSEAVVCV